MEIKTIGSGSKGNCYCISDGHSSLLIEAGVSLKDVNKALEFKLDIAGCLVSHRHIDHSKYIKSVMKFGIPVYSAKETFEHLKIKSFAAKEIDSENQFCIGLFSIRAFSTQHDCDGSLGFLIYSEKTGEKLLFATDTYYITPKFKGLTHILVEANYSEKTLDPDCPYKKRLIESHFSLENVIEFLKANDLSKVKEIHLMHLSDGNSDEKYFKEEVQKATGKHVIICGGVNV